MGSPFPNYSTKPGWSLPAELSAGPSPTLYGPGPVRDRAWQKCVILTLILEQNYTRHSNAISYPTKWKITYTQLSGIQLTQFHVIHWSVPIQRSSTAMDKLTFDGVGANPAFVQIKLIDWGAFTEVHKVSLSLWIR